MKEETLAAKDYRLGMVREVFQGEDGRVRSASIEYKNPNEKVFRSTVRPIQKLILIVSDQKEDLSHQEAQGPC
jgi:hypothetical protein